MFVPLGDDTPLRVIRLQTVTITVIAANVFIFLFTGANAGDETLLSLAGLWGVVPAELSYDAGAAQGPVAEPVTLLTYQFLHGGWLHLVSNMLFLWVFADNVEDAYGHFGFALFYMLSGVAGGLAHTLVDPHSPNPLIGASGAVSGVLAAYLVLYPRARIWLVAFVPIPIRLSAIWVLSGWFLFQLWSLFQSRGGPIDVAWWAHIGGFLFGLAITFLLRGRLAFPAAR